MKVYLEFSSYSGKCSLVGHAGLLTDEAQYCVVNNTWYWGWSSIRINKVIQEKELTKDTWKKLDKIASVFKQA